MIIAVTTSDGMNLTKDHYGEGRYFILYRLENGKFTEYKRIGNTSSEERHHGDDTKAKQIGEIVREADALVGIAFGPNIVKMRRRFAIVVSRILSIDETIRKLETRIDELAKAVESEPKGIIYIN